MGSDTTISHRTWFLRTQAAWITDQWHLRIWEKSRQVGATITDAFDSVLKVSPADARFDGWVTSRDDIAARLYLEDCIEWAKILNLGAGQTALPADLESACVEQVAAWFQNRDKLGLDTIWPHAGTYQKFNQLDLLSSVQQVLRRFVRFTL